MSNECVSHFGNWLRWDKLVIHNLIILTARLLGNWRLSKQFRLGAFIQRAIILICWQVLLQLTIEHGMQEFPFACAGRLLVG